MPHQCFDKHPNPLYSFLMQAQDFEQWVRKITQEEILKASPAYTVRLNKDQARILLSIVGQATGGGPREVTDLIWKQLHLQGLEAPTYRDGENGRLMVRIVSEPFFPFWLEWKNKPNPLEWKNQPNPGQRPEALPSTTPDANVPE